MSEQNKQNWKILIGSVGAISMLLISMWLNNYVDNQKDQSAKINQIWENTIAQQYRDSIQNMAIASTRAELIMHQIETKTAINTLMQSILDANIQLSEGQRAKNATDLKQN